MSDKYEHLLMRFRQRAESFKGQTGEVAKARRTQARRAYLDLKSVIADDSRVLLKDGAITEMQFDLINGRLTNKVKVFCGNNSLEKVNEAARIAKEVVDRAIGERKEALELEQLRAENERLKRENANLTTNNECLMARNINKFIFVRLHFALLLVIFTCLIALFCNIK